MIMIWFYHPHSYQLSVSHCLPAFFFRDEEILNFHLYFIANNKSLRYLMTILFQLITYRLHDLMQRALSLPEDRSLKGVIK